MHTPGEIITEPPRSLPRPVLGSHLNNAFIANVLEQHQVIHASPRVHFVVELRIVNGIRSLCSAAGSSARSRAGAALRLPGRLLLLLAPERALAPPHGSHAARRRAERETKSEQYVPLLVASRGCSASVRRVSLSPALNGNDTDVRSVFWAGPPVRLARLERAKSGDTLYFLRQP